MIIFKKRCSLILAFSFFLTVSFSNISHGETNDDATKILKIIEDKQKTIKSYTIDFEVYRDGKLSTAGKEMHKKPNLKRVESSVVEYEVPSKTITICDGKYIWSYIPIASMVTKEKMPPSVQNNSSLIFTDDQLVNGEYVDENGDKIKVALMYNGIEDDNGIECYVFDAKKEILTKNSEKYTYHGTIYYNKETGITNKVIWYDKDDKIKSVWIFKNYKIVDIDDSLFKFTIPKDAIVNDLTKQEEPKIIRGIFIK